MKSFLTRWLFFKVLAWLAKLRNLQTTLLGCNFFYDFVLSTIRLFVILAQSITSFMSSSSLSKHQTFLLYSLLYYSLFTSFHFLFFFFSFCLTVYPYPFPHLPPLLPPQKKNEAVTSQNGLHQEINEPTHIWNNSFSCIDLMFNSEWNLLIDPSFTPKLSSQIIQ